MSSEKHERAKYTPVTGEDIDSITERLATLAKKYGTAEAEFMGQSIVAKAGDEPKDLEKQWRADMRFKPVAHEDWDIKVSVHDLYHDKDLLYHAAKWIRVNSYMLDHDNFLIHVDGNVYKIHAHDGMVRGIAGHDIAYIWLHDVMPLIEQITRIETARKRYGQRGA